MYPPQIFQISKWIHSWHVFPQNQQKQSIHRFFELTKPAPLLHNGQRHHRTFWSHQKKNGKTVPLMASVSLNIAALSGYHIVVTCIILSEILLVYVDRCWYHSIILARVPRFPFWPDPSSTHSLRLLTKTFNQHLPPAGCSPERFSKLGHGWRTAGFFSRESHWCDRRRWSLPTFFTTNLTSMFAAWKLYINSWVQFSGKPTGNPGNPGNNVGFFKGWQGNVFQWFKPLTWTTNFRRKCQRKIARSPVSCRWLNIQIDIEIAS